MTSDDDPRQSIHCMEVWGGNRTIRSGVAMAGLDACVSSHPLGGSEGGDVYYLSSCASGRVSRLFLADIAGHGEAVSSLAEDLRTLLRKYVNWIDQRRFVEDVNRAFAAQQSSGIFATSIAATWFAPAQSIWVSSAGHPMPALFRARDSSWNFLRAGRGTVARSDVAPENARDREPAAHHNLPLGVETPTQYDALGLRLRTGDMLVFYTDAVPEARNADGNQFGYNRLLDALRASPARTPPEVISHLESAVLAYCGGRPPDDDLTILAVRRNESDQSLLPISERRRFPGLFARAVLDRLRGASVPVPWPQWSIANIGGALIERLNRVGLPPVDDDDHTPDAPPR